MQNLINEHNAQRVELLQNEFDLTEICAADGAKPQPLITNNTHEHLAIESAIAIVINGIHYAVLMASPNELDYLALGFLYSEGIIEHSGELLDCDITHLNPMFDADASYRHPEPDLTPQAELESDFETLGLQLQDYDAYVVTLTVTQRRHQQILNQRRMLSGRTGCGMCGMTGLQQALPDLSRYQCNPPYKVNQSSQSSASKLSNSPSPRIRSGQSGQSSAASRPQLNDLIQLRYQIAQAQDTHQLTGAVHAAATLYDGKLKLFEDVGRHNALDKLIGWQLRSQVRSDYVVMTSRLSIELVQKAVRCQLPWLIGMSAPTSTAVKVAKRYGLGLAGFLRDNRVTFYN